MNEYLFFTTEGNTTAPNADIEVENCQLLGRIRATSIEMARGKLLEENSWIEKAGFTLGEFIQEQIITKEQLSDIKQIVNYLEAGSIPAYLAMSLKRLSEMVNE